MIILSKPWSVYEQRLELERRRRAARLAVGYWLLAIGTLALGFMAGQVLAYLTHHPLP